jgi:triosephosphate isomerase
MTVQYGGSVEPANAAAFLGQHGIDGVLIGGASLRADEFLAIARAALNEIQAEMQPA